MRPHSLVCRLGASDVETLTPSRSGSRITEISFIDGYERLGFGLGQAINQLSELGLRPSEVAVDLCLLAAAVTAADTRISRTTESQNAWTREIEILLPVADLTLWNTLTPLLVTTLNFLTGDRWALSFRERIPQLSTLVSAPEKLRTANPTSVCLLSGGLDSFIGAIDLLSGQEHPMFVSHYWDTNSTSTYQKYCVAALKKRFPAAAIHHIQARVGFPSDTVSDQAGENTLRGRSFLFFGLAALTADAVGGNVTVHVPENGLISLNVPLDSLRLGALSTRTTHPFYMARVNELLQGLGLSSQLSNSYGHRTKGQMAKECADLPFLRKEAKHTMSCSSPGKARFAGEQPKHCGYCVPCLIRRAAILEGWGVDDTLYLIPDLCARVLNTNKAEGQHARSFQLALARLTAKPGCAKLDIHRPGPLTDHPNELSAYESVYVEGLREVGRLLASVRAEPL